MVYKSILILGRQPAIGRAELESLYGGRHLEPISQQAIALDIEPDTIAFGRLGGSIRLGVVLAEIPSKEWSVLAQYVAKILPERLRQLPQEGKLKLGLSVFDSTVDNRQLLRTGLELKKICKKTGRSVRLVPNTEPALSSAQVLHNQLTGDLGIEFLLVHSGTKTILAQTTAVQDITAYADRDQNRPKRDARVGMLPPKLAQIIINLATGLLEPTNAHVVLDPFCGTGVILQEAALMGYGSYGTDLEPRMIDYSRANLEWLAGRHHSPPSTLEIGDATTFSWQHPFSAVAAETYLGRPLSTWPNPETLQEVRSTCNTILEKYLQNIASQIPSGLRLCLAIPAWKAPNGHIHHLPLLDHLEKMGYNRVSFECAEAHDLVYYRPEQIVARELLVITRK